MKTKTIRQFITFKASLHEIYEALMDSRKHARFTGAQARISRKAGGKFTPLEIMPRCSAAGLDFRIIPAGFNAPLEFLTGFTAYDGYIEGVNLNLVPDKKIVQSWRGSDWPENHYSMATFSLKKFRNGTRLTFTQSGVPDQYYHDISQGWRDYYWKPMKEMLGKGS